MKLCPKCNAELPDGAAFCNNCGANLSESPQDATSENASASYTDAPINNATLEEAVQKNKNTRVGIIASIVAAAIVLIVIIIIISTNVSSGSYKTPIKQLVKNMNAGNTKVESYMECVYPDFVINTYSDLHKLAKKAMPDQTDSYDKDIIYSFEDTYADFKDEYGKKYKVTYEIREADKMSDHDLRDLEDVYELAYDMLEDSCDFNDEAFYDDFAKSLEETYKVKIDKNDKKQMQKIMKSFMKDFRNVKIQAGYEVEVKMSIEGPDGHDSDKFTIYVVKIDGKWIIDPSSTSNMNFFPSNSLLDTF